MADTAVNCPLCFQSSFTSVSSLCLNLISVTTRLLECPICHQTLFGLDKYTIHLFSHTFNQPSLISFQPVAASNNSTNNNQNQISINLSVSENMSTEVPMNSGLLCNKNVRNATIEGSKSNESINDVDQSNVLERPNENLAKFVENNRFSEKSQNTLASPDLKVYLNKIETTVKSNDEYDCVSSTEDIKRCESLKKNLEPFLKYNNKSVRQKVKKDFGRKNCKYIPNDFICQNIGNNMSNANVIVGGLSQSSDGSNDICNKVNNNCDKVLSLSLNVLNTNGNEVPCSNNTQQFPFDTSINCIFDKIPHDTIKPLLHVNGVANSIENNSGKSFSNNLHPLNKSSKIISCEKDVHSSQNLCQETIMFENDEFLCKKSLDKKLILMNSAALNNTDCSPKICINEKLRVNNVATITPLSPVTKKEVASQAIQTIEESFTKTNNRFNEAAVLFINESKNKKPDCNRSDDAVQSEDLTITDDYYDRDVSDIYSCDICSFKFPDEHILSMHKQLVHSHNNNNFNEKKKLFACHLCTKSFKMRGSLMVHRRVAHPTMSVLKKLEAVAITNNDSSPGTFNVANGTDQLSPDQLFSCSMCGKTFKKESHLMQHEKTHEVKQWECDVCSKAFSTKYFLKKHRRLHTGEMPYSCSTCGKSFTFQQSYHKHLLYHSDEKPYVCCDCGRAFKELSTLHNHQRIHTGEKPFSCETCGKCFRQRVSYLVHRRIHTGVMPYKCNICNRSFRYKVSERTHKCVPPQQQSSSASSVMTNIGHISNESSHINDKMNDVISTLFTSESPTTDACNFTLEKSINEGQEYNSSNSTDNRDNSTPILSIDWQTDQQPSADEIINSNSNNKLGNEEGITSQDDVNKKAIHSKSPSISQSDLFETTDFFSLILSPTISSQSLLSPSEHLRHLTLSPNSSQNWDSSSPVKSFTDVGMSDNNNDDKNCDNNNCNNNSSEVSDVSNNGGHSSVDNSILETINEQSFKELLYDVPRFL